MLVTESLAKWAAATRPIPRTALPWESFAGCIPRRRQSGRAITQKESSKRVMTGGHQSERMLMLDDLKLDLHGQLALLPRHHPCGARRTSVKPDSRGAHAGEQRVHERKHLAAKSATEALLRYESEVTPARSDCLILRPSRSKRAMRWIACRVEAPSGDSPTMTTSCSSRSGRPFGIRCPRSTKMKWSGLSLPEASGRGLLAESRSMPELTSRRLRHYTIESVRGWSSFRRTSRSTREPSLTSFRAAAESRGRFTQSAALTAPAFR